MQDSLLVTMTVSDLIEVVKNSVKEELSKLIPPPPDRLNTPDETCIQLRCTKPTLSSYRDRGLIQEHRIGVKKVYYKDSAIAAALLKIKRYQKVSAA